MEKLAGLLSRERVLLELLLFKLVALRQLLLAGEVRFLGWASEEVDRATTKVREIELRRVLATEDLAESAGSNTSLTLRDLAETAPEPWRTILSEHRSALLGLAAELEVAATAARRLAANGGVAVTSTLDRLTGGAAPAAAPRPVGAATYGPAARWEPAAVDARFSQRL
jgi:hypothetical protein